MFLIIPLAGTSPRPTYSSVLIDQVHAHLSRKVSSMAQEGSSFPDLTIADHHYFLSRNMPDFRADRFERLVSFFNCPANASSGNFPPATFELRALLWLEPALSPAV